MKQRDTYFDSIAGLLIIVMIINHIKQWSNLTELPIIKNLDIIVFTIMPWFFFKAGMYFKNDNNNNVIRKIRQRYIKPFIYFSIIGQFFFVFYMMQNGNHDIKDYIVVPVKTLLISGAVSGNLPLWFLIPLSFVYLILNNCKNKENLLLLFTILVYSAVCFWDIKLPYYIYTILSGLIFYIIGLKMKKIQFNNYVFIASLIIYLSIYMFIPSKVDMRSNILISGYYVLWFIFGICGVITFNNLFKRIKFLNIGFLEKIGIDSMVYYVVHWIIIVLSVTVLNALNVTDPYVKFSTISLACLILLPLSKKLLSTPKLKFLIGK